MNSECWPIRWRRIAVKEIADPVAHIAEIVERDTRGDHRARHAAQHGRHVRRRRGEIARVCRETQGAHAGCTVKLWDERLTSVAAQRALHEAGRNVKKAAR